MVPSCRDPEKPQAGCYERAHITSSEARLLLLRGVLLQGYMPGQANWAGSRYRREPPV
jgi:hypothetical protein